MSTVLPSGDHTAIGPLVGPDLPIDSLPDQQPSSAPEHPAASRPDHQPSSAPQHPASSLPDQQPSSASEHPAASRPDHQPSSAPEHQPSSAPEHQPSSASEHPASSVPGRPASSPGRPAGSLPGHPPGTLAGQPTDPKILPPELSTDLPAELGAELGGADVAPGGESVDLAPPAPSPGIVVLNGAGTTALDVVRVARAGAQVEMGAAALDLVMASRRVVEQALAGDVAVYGLNTGLGPRRNERVAPDLLFDYQRHIVLSHAGAVGDPLDDEDVRATLLARLAGLACGGSGASPEVLTALANLLNTGVHPVVPEIGSVGASDLGAL